MDRPNWWHHIPTTEQRDQWPKIVSNRWLNWLDGTLYVLCHEGGGVTGYDKLGLPIWYDGLGTWEQMLTPYGNVQCTPEYIAQLLLYFSELKL